MILEGGNIAILIAPPGTQVPEFSKQKGVVAAADGAMTVIDVEAGSAKTVNGGPGPGRECPIDQGIAVTSAETFDALLTVGGCVGANSLRGKATVVEYIQARFERKKPVGAICRAPWNLIDAGVLAGRDLTFVPTLQTDLRTAGAHWTDAEIVIDQGVVFGRDPNDLPAFQDKVGEESDGSKHAA